MPPECGWKIGGDSARPCAVRAGHAGSHRDAAYRSQGRAAQKKNRSQRHAHHIRRSYGLTPEEYAAIKKYQGGTCAICGWATGRSKMLAVDHDHKTGLIRGLLHSSCNHFLGVIRDNPEAARRLLGYLEDPPAPRALGREIYVPADSPSAEATTPEAEATAIISKVLEHYGADLSHVAETGWRSMRCPFDENHAHGDRNKSARVNLELGGFICLGCQVKGDAIKLIELREGMGYVDAVRFAEEISGESVAGIRRPASGNDKRRTSRWREKLFS